MKDKGCTIMLLAVGTFHPYPTKGQQSEESDSYQAGKQVDNHQQGKHFFSLDHYDGKNFSCKTSACLTYDSQRFTKKNGSLFACISFIQLSSVSYE